jgi:hypothetical protein
MSGMHRLALRANDDDEQFARNIAEVIEDLFTRTEERSRERRIELIQIHVLRAILRYKPRNVRE